MRVHILHCRYRTRRNVIDFSLLRPSVLGKGSILERDRATAVTLSQYNTRVYLLYTMCNFSFAD